MSHPHFDLDRLLSRLLTYPHHLPTPSQILTLLSLCRPLFLSSPNVLSLPSPLVVIGDLHGQFFDFLFILRRSFSLPNFNNNNSNFNSNIGGGGEKLLFLGDVVDRGYYSTETICLILALKLKYNERVFIIRGNHESKSISSVYGFYDELRHRFEGRNCVNDGLLLSPNFKHSFNKNINFNYNNGGSGKNLFLDKKAVGNITNLENNSDGLFLNRKAVGNITNLENNSDDSKSLFLDKKRVGSVTDKIGELGGITNPVPEATTCAYPTTNISNSQNNFKMGKEEVTGVQLFRKFTELFDLFPIAAVLDGRSFCVHGGVPRSAPSLRELGALHRFGEVPFTGDICDLLWSDPCETRRLWEHNSRGAGIGYGEELTDKFLRKNGLEGVFRSHQLVMEGFKCHWGKVSTVWSAPNYCYRCGNLGSFVRVGGGGGVEVVRFEDSETQREPDELERMDVIRDV